MRCEQLQPDGFTRGCGHEHKGKLCPSWVSLGAASIQDVNRYLQESLRCVFPQPPDGRSKGCGYAHMQGSVCYSWDAMGFSSCDHVTSFLHRIGGPSHPVCSHPQPPDGKRLGCGNLVHRQVCGSWRQRGYRTWERVHAATHGPGAALPVHHGLEIEVEYDSIGACFSRGDWSQAIAECNRVIAAYGGKGASDTSAWIWRSVGYLEQEWSDLTLHTLDGTDAPMAQFVRGLAHLTGTYGQKWSHETLEDIAREQAAIREFAARAVREFARAAKQFESGSTTWLCCLLGRAIALCWAGSTSKCIAVCERILEEPETQQHQLAHDLARIMLVYAGCEQRQFNLSESDLERICDTTIAGLDPTIPASLVNMYHEFQEMESIRLNKRAKP